MPTNVGINFNGQHLIRPQAVANVNASALNGVGTSDSPKIVFIGSSLGGPPSILNWYSSPEDAKSTYKGGDLIQAADLAWAPSGDFPGAGTIGFIRAQSAVQSVLTEGNMVLTSKDYGAYTTMIQAKLENGSIDNSKKLSFYYWKDNTVEVYDNLGPIFTIKYTGSAAYAALTIDTVVDGTQNTLTVKVGDDKDSATTVLSYTLGDGPYAQVSQIVYDINQHKDFQASMITYGNKNIDTDELDSVADEDIKSGFTVTALKADIQRETQYSQLISISFLDNGEFPDNFDYSYLIGGSDGDVPTDWTDLLNLLYGEDGYIVIPLTADPSIHSEVLGFVNNQSEAERHRMLAIFGGELGETPDQATSRALTLSSSRAVLAYPGIKTYDINSTKVSPDASDVVTLPPYFTAAIIAGLISGQGFNGEPITNKSVNILGLERVLSSANIDHLLQAGITVISSKTSAITSGFHVVQGITTYQLSGNPAYREISVRVTTDDLLTNLESKLSTYIGTRGNMTNLSNILNTVQSFLDDCVTEGSLVSYDASSVNITLKNDVVNITFNCIPTQAINYITLTATYQVSNLTLTTNTLGS